MDAGDPDRGRKFPPHTLHHLLSLCLQTKQEESKPYVFSKLCSYTFVKYCFCIHSWKRLEIL